MLFAHIPNTAASAVAVRRAHGVREHRSVVCSASKTVRESSTVHRAWAACGNTLRVCVRVRARMCCVLLLVWGVAPHAARSGDGAMSAGAWRVYASMRMHIFIDHDALHDSERVITVQFMMFVHVRV